MTPSPQSRAAEVYSWEVTEIQNKNRVQQIALAIWKGKHVMMLSRIISAVVSIQVCGIDVLSRPWGSSDEVSCQVGHQGLVKYLGDVESLNRLGSLRSFPYPPLESLIIRLPPYPILIFQQNNNVVFPLLLNFFP